MLFITFTLHPFLVHLLLSGQEDKMRRQNDRMTTRVDDLESGVEKLAKIGSLMICAEIQVTRGLYMIDPDDPQLGKNPFQVICYLT